MGKKLAYLGFHPIQYQAPPLKILARALGEDFKVFFESDFSLEAHFDKEFGREIN